MKASTFLLFHPPFLGMIAPTHHADVSTRRNRKRLAIAHRILNEGWLPRLSLVEREFNARPNAKRNHITAFVSPSVKGFQSIYKSSADHFRIYEKEVAHCIPRDWRKSGRNVVNDGGKGGQVLFASSSSPSSLFPQLSSSNYPVPPRSSSEGTHTGTSPVSPSSIIVNGDDLPLLTETQSPYERRRESSVVFQEKIEKLAFKLCAALRKAMAKGKDKALYDREARAAAMDLLRNRKMKKASSSAEDDVSDDENFFSRTFCVEGQTVETALLQQAFNDCLAGVSRTHDEQENEAEKKTDDGDASFSLNNSSSSSSCSPSFASTVVGLVMRMIVEGSSTPSSSSSSSSLLRDFPHFLFTVRVRLDSSCGSREGNDVEEYAKTSSSVTHQEEREYGGGGGGRLLIEIESKFKPELFQLEQILSRGHVVELLRQCYAACWTHRILAAAGVVSSSTATGNHSSSNSDDNKDVVQLLLEIRLPWIHEFLVRESTIGSGVLQKMHRRGSDAAIVGEQNRTEIQSTKKHSMKLCMEIVEGLIQEILSHSISTDVLEITGTTKPTERKVQEEEGTKDGADVLISNNVHGNEHVDDRRTTPPPHHRSSSGGIYTTSSPSSPEGLLALHIHANYDFLYIRVLRTKTASPLPSPQPLKPSYGDYGHHHSIIDGESPTTNRALDDLLVVADVRNSMMNNTDDHQRRDMLLPVWSMPIHVVECILEKRWYPSEDALMELTEDLNALWEDKVEKTIIPVILEHLNDDRLLSIDNAIKKKKSRTADKAAAKVLLNQWRSTLLRCGKVHVSLAVAMDKVSHSVQRVRIRGGLTKDDLLSFSDRMSMLGNSAEPNSVGRTMMGAMTMMGDSGGEDGYEDHYDGCEDVGGGSTRRRKSASSSTRLMFEESLLSIVNASPSSGFNNLVATLSEPEALQLNKFWKRTPNGTISMKRDVHHQKVEGARDSSGEYFGVSVGLHTSNSSGAAAVGAGGTNLLGIKGAATGKRAQWSVRQLNSDDMPLSEEEEQYWREHYYKLRAPFNVVFADKVDGVKRKPVATRPETDDETRSSGRNMVMNPSPPQGETEGITATQAAISRSTHPQQQQRRLATTTTTVVKLKSIEEFSLHFTTIMKGANVIRQYDLGPSRCTGLHYSIVLEALLEKEAKTTRVVQSALASLKTNGVINYFGHERFGSHCFRNCHPGLHLLRGEFRAAAAILVNSGKDWEYSASGGFGDASDPHPRSQREAALVEKETPVQRKLRSALENSPDGGSSEATCKEAFIGVLGPKVCRSFVAEFLTYIWNDCASQRVKRLGRSVVVGDIVLRAAYLRNKTRVRKLEKKKKKMMLAPLCEEEAKTIQDEGDQQAAAGHGKERQLNTDEEGTKEVVVAENDDVEDDDEDDDGAEATSIAAAGLHIVTQRDIDQRYVTKYDVLLPIPGCGIILPDNGTAGIMTRVLEGYSIRVNPETEGWSVFEAGGGGGKDMNWWDPSSTTTAQQHQQQQQPSGGGGGGDVSGGNGTGIVPNVIPQALSSTPSLVGNKLIVPSTSATNQQQQQHTQVMIARHGTDTVSQSSMGGGVSGNGLGWEFRGGYRPLFHNCSDLKWSVMKEKDIARDEPELGEGSLSLVKLETALKVAGTVQERKDIRYKIELLRAEKHSGGARSNGRGRRRGVPSWQAKDQWIATMDFDLPATSYPSLLIREATKLEKNAADDISMDSKHAETVEKFDDLSTRQKHEYKAKIQRRRYLGAAGEGGARMSLAVLRNRIFQHKVGGLIPAARRPRSVSGSI